MATITAFLAAWGIELAVGSVGALALGWLLGKGMNLAPAILFFDKLARLGGRAGDFVDAFGKRKLGAAISNPLEDLLYYTVGRPLENFFASLRKDNPAKLEKYLGDLKASESETRAKAIADKLKEMSKHPSPLLKEEEAAIAYRQAVRGAADFTANRLRN